VDGDGVSEVAFLLDGRTLVSAGPFDSTKLWNAATGLLIRSFGQADIKANIALSPDGRQLLSGNRNAAPELWDVATGSLIRSFEEPAEGIASDKKITQRNIVRRPPLVDTVLFSPDGELVLSGYTDGTKRLWDAASGALIRNSIAIRTRSGRRPF
jgi:WD40 repeat protein